MIRFVHFWSGILKKGSGQELQEIFFGISSGQALGDFSKYKFQKLICSKVRASQKIGIIESHILNRKARKA